MLYLKESVVGECVIFAENTLYLLYIPTVRVQEQGDAMGPEISYIWSKLSGPTIKKSI